MQLRLTQQLELALPNLTTSVLGGGNALSLFLSPDKNAGKSVAWSTALRSLGEN